ncbi:hypothetical protein [Actinospongicola halichondriae]|uniref:hypothetical protein n=1 Tax=Actinospongicola halichondriae TaxID=3236844 RepID=UPI003D47A2A9
MPWGRRKQVGGRSVPAVIVDYGRGRTAGETPPESLKASTRTEAIVQLDGDTRRQHVTGKVSGLAFWMMAEGDTVPVIVDDADLVVGFDRPALDALYQARKSELKESLKPHSVVNDVRRSIGLDREQLSDIGPAIRDLAAVPKQVVDAIRNHPETSGPVAEPAPPIDGVSFSTFVAVQAALVRDRVTPDRHDDVAQSHGVAPGAWPAAHEAWMGLVRSDRAVGQAFGAAYAAAMKS